MKILFKFSFTDPNNVGIWPPSIVNSSWLSGIQSWLQANETGIGAVIFDDQTALTNWLNTYRLTDATLLADLAAWKTAHNITFTSSYYELTDSTAGNSNIVD